MSPFDPFPENMIFCCFQSAFIGKQFGLIFLFVLGLVTNLVKGSRKYKRIKLFVSNAPFLYLLKTSENRNGVEKRCTENKWVN